jgi:hypothetical protein
MLKSIKINNRKNCLPLGLIRLVFIIILFIPSCSGHAGVEYIDKNNYLPQNYLTIWSHSDIQPRDAAERKFYDKAIQDINSNFPAIDMALVAGDIVNWSTSENDYKWYVKNKENTLIKYWYEIAGNHDQKCIEGYKKYIHLPLDYSVEIGNILILCMSDETDTAAQEISDGVFRWWKHMVKANQDKIIITMTHAYLKESRMFMTSFPSRNIKDSWRFAEVMKHYRVDVWICGHAHLSHGLGLSLSASDNLNGTLFINTSAIKNSESYLLFFKKDSADLVIKSRDHEKQIFNTDDLIFRLKKNFIWNNSVPVMKPYTEESDDK